MAPDTARLLTRGLCPQPPDMISGGVPAGGTDGDVHHPKTPRPWTPSVNSACISGRLSTAAWPALLGCLLLNASTALQQPPAQLSESPKHVPVNISSSLALLYSANSSRAQDSWMEQFTPQPHRLAGVGHDGLSGWGRRTPKRPRPPPASGVMPSFPILIHFVLLGFQDIMPLV